ncbi:MAG: ATP-dependent RecD-like DNA helicase [Zavarzinella sp.]
MQPQETLSGTIERVTFHNQENGYVVLRIKARQHRDLVTLVGNLQQVIVGEHVEASGKWVNDKNHGMQFQAENIRTMPPHSKEGIIKYLGSGLIKGIGPTYAKKIVDVFGEKTLEIIDQTPLHLTEIRGIGPARIEQIRRSWKEQKGIRDVMVFLQTHGIGTARAVRIYKRYGDESITMIRQNPYRLITDIWGIGFKTADELGMALGIPANSPLRAYAAVRYALQEFVGKGHVGYPELAILHYTINLVGIEEQIIKDAIEQGVQNREFVRETPQRVPEFLSDEYAHSPWLFLRSLHQAEVGVAEAIQKLCRQPHPLGEVNVECLIPLIEAKMGLTLAPQQREAVYAATQAKALIVTGGPGVGKTTIIRAMLGIFQQQRKHVTLAAPTGRAAKRMTESTGTEAKTIHRLLEYDPVNGTFIRDRHDPIHTDLVIVDETSMVDMVLMYQLLSAIPPSACVIFVGDVDQLPSVGPGTVLQDMIASGVLTVVRLTQIFRQAQSSLIIQAAHAIHSGMFPQSGSRPDQDFFYIEAEEPTEIIEKLLAMIQERIPKRFGMHPINDIQVLSPMNRSELGVIHLNERLQESLNPFRPNGGEVQLFGRKYRPGDKVLQIRNNYTKEVYNGDIGIVQSIDPEDQEITVQFEQRLLKYRFTELDELVLAYACSIHKSQGSEYPAVLIPVHTQHYMMLQRNLLYTGVTRGKKLVVLLGSKRALGQAIRRQEASERLSLLQQRLVAK